jgi:hypothetical protein
MPQKVVSVNTPAKATKAHWTILFLPNFLARMIHRHIEQQRDYGHQREQHEGHAGVQLHQHGDVKRQAGLEHGEGHPVQHVAGDELLELVVGKGLAQGLEHFALAGGGVGVFVLVDGKCRHLHAYYGQRREYAYGRAVASRIAQRGFKKSRHVGHQVGDGGAKEEGYRNEGGEVHAGVCVRPSSGIRALNGVQ